MASTGETPPVRARQIRRVLAGILLANLAVVVAKALVALHSRSLAVLGDTIHAATDAGNNIIALAVVRFAARAPDADHPYGHGKYETLGALIVVIFLSAAMLELLQGAVTRLIGGSRPATATMADVALMVATLAVNLWVVWFETRAGQRLQSDILLADAAHTRADVIITLSVIGGLLLTRAGLSWADPVLALLVAVMIIRVGYGIVKRSIPSLVDEVAVDRDVVGTTALAVAGVRSVYDIRSRKAAQLTFAELTIAVDGSENVAAAHRIADQVEAHLRRELGLDQVVVHVEPC